MGKGSNTRDAILHAALGQASRIGLEGLSIGALAKHVGMSKSGLFAHFGSKEGLQIAVLQLGSQLFVDRVVRPALAQPRGEPRIRALSELWLDWAESTTEVPAGCLFVSAAAEFDDRPGLVRDQVVKLVSDWRKTLTLAAHLAIGEGHLAEDLDPDQFAFELHALLLGHQLQRRLLGNDDARSRTLVAVDRLIAACR